MAEWSKALCLGLISYIRSPKGREFESHCCHILFFDLLMKRFVETSL